MKKLVVDGHNLVPKIPGLHLSDLDDESKLIGLLGEYCRLQRTRSDLFFDGSPPGSRRSARHGLVIVHNVRQGTTADDAILAFLHKSGTSAREVIVVTSDHRVQAEARALRATVITSEAFSQQLQRVLASPKSAINQSEVQPSEEEVAYWLAAMTKKSQDDTAP